MRWESNHRQRYFAQEVGRWIPPGIGVGMEKAMPDLQNQVDSEMEELASRMQTAVAIETGGITVRTRAKAEHDADTDYPKGGGDTYIDQHIEQEKQLSCTGCVSCGGKQGTKRGRQEIVRRCEVVNFIDFTLECNGRTLTFGMSPNREKREFGITKITGLESSDLELNLTDNALVDGSTMDGKRIKSRPIHIEAELRDDRNNEVNRQRIIKFFNPKYAGKMTINHSGTRRNIEYELEGWNFVATNNVHNHLAIVVDLKCADPFWKNIDNFGQNMADISKHIAFPWRVVKKKVICTGTIQGAYSSRPDHRIPDAHERGIAAE